MNKNIVMFQFLKFEQLLNITLNVLEAQECEHTRNQRCTPSMTTYVVRTVKKQEKLPTYKIPTELMYQNSRLQCQHPNIPIIRSVMNFLKQ